MSSLYGQYNMLIYALLTIIFLSHITHGLGLTSLSFDIQLKHLVLPPWYPIAFSQLKHLLLVP